MAGLRAGHPAGERLRADDSFVSADADTLDGRVEPCHGDMDLIAGGNPKVRTRTIATLALKRAWRRCRNSRIG
jgi:hypothetical protein